MPDPTENFDLTPGGSVKPTFAVKGSFSEGWKPHRAAYAHTYNRSALVNGGLAAPKGHMASMLSNINDGVVPFTHESNCIHARDAIELCQKAYWNVSIFRLTIDIMTEFSNSPLHFKGTNKQSLNFFKRWWSEVVGGWKLGDQFFREWFRSGNVFLYRFDGTIDLSRLRNLKEVRAATEKDIPIRYLLLNPADMRCSGAASFVNAEYSKAINDYELARLRNPKTAEEVQFKESLDPGTRKQIDEGGTPLIVLDQERLSAVFCKKQDYEPMSVPMYFPVLYDINLKIQMKKAESVVAKTTDYIILLIKMGAPPDKMGNSQYDEGLMTAMQTLFKTESVGRVLVADWTTEMEFVIPDLNKILGPEKYQVVNRDIADGLMNIFFNEQKFADSMIKIKMFLERLNEARKAFLELFLKPEMRRVAKEMGFRQIPEVEFETVDLKDEVEYMKIYNRLAELGLLTPEETFDAFKTNQLPTPEDSLEAQEEFKKMRDKGLYEPLIGGGQKENEEGRPPGAKAPQKKKNPKPAGATVFSCEKLAETFRGAHELIPAVEKAYKKHHGIQRLSKHHRARARELVDVVVGNERRENWEASIEKYLSGGFSPDMEVVEAVSEIAFEHGLDDNMAALLYHSRKG